MNGRAASLGLGGETGELPGCSNANFLSTCFHYRSLQTQNLLPLERLIGSHLPWRGTSLVETGDGTSHPYVGLNWRIFQTVCVTTIAEHLL